MIFTKKRPPPPCHLRQFVATKESWDAALRLLEFTPKTNHLSLRRQSIDSATLAAIKSSYLLLAVELFNMATNNDSRLELAAGEEPLILECLAFSSSFICNIINPESEDYELYLDARQSIVESISLMTLLNNADVENTLLARFELYDKAAESTDREEYLSDTLARVLTYLADGERFSRIKLRYEDPAGLVHRATAQHFISNAILKVKEMVSLIIKRNMDEEELLEDDTDRSSDEGDDLEQRVDQYHNQIDSLVESSHSFFLDRFGERKDAGVNGHHSLKTLSVFAVHAATLLATKRDFPRIHPSSLNGFTRTLSFRTPNTMPNVQPPEGMLVSYSGEEESFMHEQTEIFERQGMGPLARNLLRHLGGNESDFNPLCDHLDLAARQASSTYLPYLAEE